MESIKFPEANGDLAKSQPQFRPLYVCKLPDPDGMPTVFQYTYKLQLSDLEIEQIIKTRCLFATQLGSCFHPSSVRVESPFLSILVEWNLDESGVYHAWVKNNSGSIDEFGAVSPEQLIDTIINKYNDLDCADQLYFREKSALSVGENGLEGM